MPESCPVKKKPSVTLVVPTFQERENIIRMVPRLNQLLGDWNWEVVFVDDDSDDKSLPVLLDLARNHPKVRFLRRIGRRGLASACLEGMASSAADLFVVMDADFQHDETILPSMLEAFQDDQDLDLAVGTRYCATGGVGDWSKPRQHLSRLATFLEKHLLRTPLSDPMSGFFVIRRQLYEETARRLTGKGFKILLDLVLSSPRQLRIREFPYIFRSRQHGESKLDLTIGLEYLYLLADKTLGRIFPVSFILYILAGLSGLLLHLAILAGLHLGVGMAFVTAQIGSTIAAMTSNFLVNNAVTFRSSRLRGAALIPGLVAYIAICGLGAIVNVESAHYLFQNHIPWWFAGASGALIGAVWNYAVSTQIVWTWLSSALKNYRQ